MPWECSARRAFLAESERAAARHQRRCDKLATLAERLFDLGVGNYYLHQLDKVEGAAHFEVSDDRALDLVETLRARLPGYLVPRLVREIAGAGSKKPITEVPK
jgi:L-lysine 2,3-aminomutase